MRAPDALSLPVFASTKFVKSISPLAPFCENVVLDPPSEACGGDIRQRTGTSPRTVNGCAVAVNDAANAGDAIKAAKPDMTSARFIEPPASRARCLHRFRQRVERRFRHWSHPDRHGCG